MKLYKNMLAGMISLVFVAACMQGNDVKSVSVAELGDKLESKNGFVVLDVRTPEEFNEGYIPGAININYHDADFKQQLEKLDKEKTCYVYCRSGNRSTRAAIIMNDLHFKEVYNVEGGMLEWQEQGREVAH